MYRDMTIHETSDGTHDTGEEPAGVEDEGPA